MFPLIILIVYSSAIFSYTYIKTSHGMITSVSDMHTTTGTCAMTKSTLTTVIQIPSSQADSQVDIRAFVIRQRHQMQAVIHTTILNIKYIFILYFQYAENVY